MLSYNITNCVSVCVHSIYILLHARERVVYYSVQWRAVPGCVCCIFSLSSVHRFLCRSLIVFALTRLPTILQPGSFPRVCSPFFPLTRGFWAENKFISRSMIRIDYVRYFVHGVASKRKLIRSGNLKANSLVKAFWPCHKAIQGEKWRKMTKM